MIARWMVVVGSVAAFLVASKAHGRQLRLERQLAGYWQVRFGAPNEPWVEALWQRERLLFWSITAALIAAAAAYLLAAPRFGWPLPLARRGERSWWGGVPFVGIWPFVVGFTVTGLLSFKRFLTATSHDDWVRPALWGSVAWWIATLVLAVALVHVSRSTN